jgi:hypothetical protein
MMSDAWWRMSRWAVRPSTLLPALAVALATTPAAAHVAPAQDANNRYLKLSPMADRVRVAYTILIGHQPARATRRALDRDGDQVVSPAEAEVWGAELAAQILAGLEVHIDGVAVPVAWSEIHVGMDDRRVAAGAFSLDLIAWLCTPGPGPRHQLDLVDPWALTPAGETEVRVADEPGIRIEVGRVGRHGELIRRVASFQGQAAPLAEGVRLVWDASDARPLADGRCPRAGAARRRPRWPLGLAAAVGLGAAAVAMAVARRRRRARSPGATSGPPPDQKLNG